MKMHRTPLIATLITAAGLGLATAAHADQDDIIHLPEARISLLQAVEAAQRHHEGSKALHAEFEHKHGRLYYEVEVLTPDNRVYDLIIDAHDGKVLDSRLDWDD